MSYILAFIAWVDDVQPLAPTLPWQCQREGSTSVLGHCPRTKPDPIPTTTAVATESSPADVTEPTGTESSPADVTLPDADALPRE